MSRSPYEFIRHLAAQSLRRGLWSIGQAISGPFRHIEGNCWFVDWPDSVALDPRRMVLAEDGVRLAGSGSDLGVIKKVGYGAYQFRDEGVYFSSSDNSVPNQNGRQYRLVRNPANVFVNYIPVNSRPAKLSDSEIERRVQDATGVLAFIDHFEEISGTTLDGKDILEIGPGADYGWAMIMSCCGARCSVVDPFVPVWSDDYHPRFLAALAKRLQTLPRIVTLDPIHQLLQTCDFKRSGLICYDEAAEELKAPSEAFDLVLSAAVGEHFYDITSAFREMARITRPGGIGLHVIDLRDHRDFSRPLEYLLMTDEDFWKEFVLRHAECANRYRAQEFLNVCRQVGFHVISHEGKSSFDAEYLDDFIPRLRRGANQRYRSLAVADLQPSTVLIKLQKQTKTRK